MARAPVDPRAVIRTYLTIAGLYTLAASLIWGVNTLFLLDAGLSLFETFLANAAFTAGMVLFEIPTGVVADTRGRRVSFLASLAVLGLSTLGYVALAEVGAGLLAFSVASVFLGLGFTFYSGAVDAWMVDALEATGHEGELDPIFARGSQVTAGAMLVGTIGGGLLGQIDLSLPFVVRSALLGLLLLYAWRAMQEIGFEPRPLELRAVPREVAEVTRVSLEHGWGDRQVRLLMLLAFLQMGFLAWGWYAWQPYFLDLLGRDAIWIAGVIAATISLATIGGNALAAPLARWLGRRSSALMVTSAILSAAMVGVGLAGAFLPAVGLFVVGMVALGALTPVRQAYIHALVPSQARATVVSFDGLLGSAGGILNQAGLGRLAEVRSLGLGYVVGGAILVLALPILLLLRWTCGDEDLVAPAEDPAAPAACAAQGTPEISGVDTRGVE